MGACRWARAQSGTPADCLDLPGSFHWMFLSAQFDATSLFASSIRMQLSLLDVVTPDLMIFCYLCYLYLLISIYSFIFSCYMINKLTTQYRKHDNHRPFSGLYREHTVITERWLPGLSGIQVQHDSFSLNEQKFSSCVVLKVRFKVFQRIRGWKDGSVDKSTWCSSRVPSTHIRLLTSNLSYHYLGF